MEQPWLSVVMPTFNGEKYLSAALESLVDQEQNGFECIAVDDGSTDQTLDILQSYEKRLDLHILNGEHVGNWVAGTNRGLRQARGKFVSFLHQDDLWRPNRARRFKRLSEAWPDCTFFSANADFIDASGRKVGRWRPPLPVGRSLSGEEVLERLIVQDFFAINNPMFLRSRALELGGLDETLWYTADWDFWLRLMPGVRACHVADTLCAFRVHPKSQTVLGSKRSNEFKNQINAVLEYHLDQHPRLTNDIVSRARLSAEINVGLAQAYDQRSMRAVLHLGMKVALRSPLDQYRLLRDSGLGSRVSARLRAL